MRVALGAWLTTRRIAGIAGIGYVLGVSIENMEALGAPTLTSSVDEIRAHTPTGRSGS
jgi:hypothetical protein